MELKRKSRSKEKLKQKELHTKHVAHVMGLDRLQGSLIPYLEECNLHQHVPVVEVPVKWFPTDHQTLMQTD